MTVKFLPKLRKKSPYLVTLSLGFLSLGLVWRPKLRKNAQSAERLKGIFLQQFAASDKFLRRTSKPTPTCTLHYIYTYTTSTLTLHLHFIYTYMYTTSTPTCTPTLHLLLHLPNQGGIQCWRYRQMWLEEEINLNLVQIHFEAVINANCIRTLFLFRA